MQPTQSSPTLDEVKKVIWVAVKENAREKIGQPKPTRIRGSKRDGRRRAGVTGGLDIYDPPEQEMEIPNLPHMATNPALHGRAVTGIPSRYLHDAKKRREEKESLFHFTPAAVAHANFLLKSQGQEATDKYLREIKESRHMDHGQMAVDIREKREKEEHKIGTGLEMELEKLKARAKYCREQSKLLEDEAKNLDKAILHLETADGLLGGKTARPAPGERTPHGEWNNRWPTLLATPLTRKALTKAINEQYGVANPYGTITKALEKGRLREVDGKIELVPGE